MMEQIQYISVDDIIPNRFQPRKKFEQEDLQELAESIKQHGIIQPLVLRRLGSKFEIIAGERRYKAANIVGLKQVPSIVMELDDKTSAEIALAENIQRKDLTAIERARSYKQILGLGQITQEELAKKMGKSQPSVSNTLRLLELTDEVQQALLKNRISERHARSLLVLKNPDDQIQMLDKIIKNRMTVRETDLAIKEALQNKKETPKKEEEIIDFSNENMQSNNKPDDFIIEDIQNDNKNNIPDFDQIDINKPEEKTSFLNNYSNLDDEAANMNSDSDDTNISFDNFINIPNNVQNLNTIKEKEEKEVSATPMISDPNSDINNQNIYSSNQEYRDIQSMNNPDTGLPNYKDPQGTFSNNSMMPPQGVFPNNGIMPPQGMFPNNGMIPPQGIFPNNSMMPPQGIFPNNGMMPPQDMYTNEINTNTPDVQQTLEQNSIIEPIQDIQPQAIIMQHDITGAVAVIRNTIMNLQNNGYMIDITEDDLSNAYSINIKIEK